MPLFVDFPPLTSLTPSLYSRYSFGMMRVAIVLAFVAIAACSDDEPQGALAVRIAEEVERTAGELEFWPRFDPRDIPLAIYDGTHTYLFRHPKVPEGFVRADDDESGSLVFDGRHPAMTANSSAEIGGVMTATLLIEDIDQERDSASLAGIAIHEAFHVFQRLRYPAWAANEGVLFTYPVDGPALLSLRRLETEALRRALEATDSQESECWARLALSHRAERFSEMDAEFTDYERGTELNEGLATYVQHKADGRGTVKVPTEGFAATEIRSRAYVTGAALAMLIDRIDPGWPNLFDTNSRHSLDQILQSRLNSGARSRTGACEFTPAETQAAEEQARRDVAAVNAARVERRARFDDRGPWRLVIRAAEGRPLWPEGFDPLNVENIQGGVLHTRFLRLGNDQGDLEAIDTGDVDIEALTVAAGSHPLFNGIKEVTIAGLPEIEMAAEDGGLSVQVPGFKAEFELASIYREAGATIVQLARPE